MGRCTKMRANLTLEHQTTYNWVQTMKIYFTKYNAVPANTMTTCREYRGIAPLILSPQHLMNVTNEIHDLAALPLGKESRYPVNGKLGGPQ